MILRSSSISSSGGSGYHDRGGARSRLTRVQAVFGYLQESEKQFVDARGVIVACKDGNNQPLDLHEQQVCSVTCRGVMYVRTLKSYQS